MDKDDPGKFSVSFEGAQNPPGYVQLFAQKVANWIKGTAGQTIVKYGSKQISGLPYDIWNVSTDQPNAGLIGREFVTQGEYYFTTTLPDGKLANVRARKMTMRFTTGGFALGDSVGPSKDGVGQVYSRSTIYATLAVEYDGLYVYLDQKTKTTSYFPVIRNKQVSFNVAGKSFTDVLGDSDPVLPGQAVSANVLATYDTNDGHPYITKSPISVLVATYTIPIDVAFSEDFNPSLASFSANLGFVTPDAPGSVQVILPTDIKTSGANKCRAVRKGYTAIISLTNALGMGKDLNEAVTYNDPRARGLLNVIREQVRDTVKNKLVSLIESDISGMGERCERKVLSLVRKCFC
ncbi:hypothetical protein C7438_0799 [Brockia lithotrophica]|uniref:Uncharacterized protein n=1 Tax=Brockia lithotrophica TaxID=933949 RepID=A0A660KYI6_9BACL|nr:hypothetical protein C7438_0799 [Brockia lithotrophica]